MRAGKIQIVCDACGGTIVFPGSDAGSVQDCPQCGGFLDVPEFRRKDLPEDPDLIRDRERYERNCAENDRQIEVARRQLERADLADQRRDALQNQEARLQARWSELLERFSRILDRWEKTNEPGIRDGGT